MTTRTDSAAGDTEVFQKALHTLMPAIQEFRKHGLDDHLIALVFITVAVDLFADPSSCRREDAEAALLAMTNRFIALRPPEVDRGLLN